MSDIIEIFRMNINFEEPTDEVPLFNIYFIIEFCRDSFLDNVNDQ